jgi:hypothetical protein
MRFWSRRRCRARWLEMMSGAWQRRAALMRSRIPTRRDTDDDLVGTGSGSQTHRRGDDRAFPHIKPTATAWGGRVACRCQQRYVIRPQHPHHMKRLLLPATVAALVIAIPASAEARSCAPDRTTADGTTIEVDAYGAATCSFAKATASRFYAVDRVPRHLTVLGARLTRRGTQRGSGWTMWSFGGRRHGRALLVIITQKDPSPSAPPSSSPPAASAPPSSSSTPTCDPNYQGACLDPSAFDYDCLGGSGDGPRYTGRVVMVGYDHFGLDADGDGIGCESS